jgi:starvation-inducible outer membrane lipoprotein
MHIRRFLLPLISSALLLVGCSSGPNPEELQKQNEVKELTSRVCEVVKEVVKINGGKDSLNGRDMLEVFNREVDPKKALSQFNEDYAALEALVGKFIDPETGSGWFKLCNLG